MIECIALVSMLSSFGVKSWSCHQRCCITAAFLTSRFFSDSAHAFAKWIDAEVTAVTHY